MFTKGQLVYVKSRYATGLEEPVAVERVTKTQAIVGGARYYRASGQPIDKYNRNVIYAATPENKEMLEKVFEREAQRRAEKEAEQQAREQAIAERNRQEMEAFKAAVTLPTNIDLWPKTRLEMRTLPDGSRLYSALLPGQEDKDVTFSQVFIRVTDVMEQNWRTEEVEHNVRLHTTWCTNASDSFPSCSGERVPVEQERQAIERILCTVWHRTW